MRKLKRLGCALLAALCLLGGALAESVEPEAEPAPAAQKQAASEPASKPAAEAAEKPAKAAEAKEETSTAQNDAPGSGSASSTGANTTSEPDAGASSNKDGDSASGSNPSNATDNESTGTTPGESGDGAAGATDTAGSGTQDAPDGTDGEGSADATTDTGTNPPADGSPDDPAGESGEGNAGGTGEDVPGDDPAQDPDDPADSGVANLSITARASDGVVTQDGAYRVPAGQGGTLTLSWGGANASAYRLNLSNGQGSVYSGTQSECTYVVDLSALQPGRYTFTVEGVADGDIVARGTFTFTLSAGDDQPGEGFPGGGRPGGSGFHGGGSRGGSRGKGNGAGDDMDGEADGSTGSQGVRITPGEALTSTHTSGTKDTQLYGTVELSVNGKSMRQLVLGDEYLDVLLDEGRRSFTAEIEGGTLTLTASRGERWSLNGRTLKRLAASGIDTLVLQTDAHTRAIATTLEPQGYVYAGLRAEGYVSTDFDYTVSADGIRVSVGGVNYSLEDAGELIPMEGDGHASTMDDPAAGAA